MENIIETIEKKYNSINPEIKEALFSPELAVTIENIGQNQKLDIEKMGVLFDEIVLVMLGEVTSKDFEKRLTPKLNIDNEKMRSLVQEVDEKIFSPLRESILTENVELTSKEEGQKPISQPVEVSDNTGINRENILAEIENPTPAVYPISIADQTIPGPAKPREIVNLPMIKEATGSATKNTSRDTGVARNTNVAGDTVASEFIAGKLTETVSLPSKKENVSQKYTADPYREPIN